MVIVSQQLAFYRASKVVRCEHILNVSSSTGTSLVSEADVDLPAVSLLRGGSAGSVSVFIDMFCINSENSADKGASKLKEGAGLDGLNGCSVPAA